MAPFGVLLILKILTNSLDYTNFSDLLSDLFDKLNGNKEVQLRNMTKEKSFWKNIYNHFGILLLLFILSIFYFSIIFKARKFRLDRNFILSLHDWQYFVPFEFMYYQNLNTFSLQIRVSVWSQNSAYFSVNFSENLFFPARVALQFSMSNHCYLTNFV